MKNIKDYFEQIKLEIKKITGSKLLMIFIGILLLFSIASPILSTLDVFGPRYYYGGYEEGDLEVDGVTIDNENMYYWEILQFDDRRSYLKENAVSDLDDLSLELVEIMLKDYLKIAQTVTSHEDYRTQIVWRRREFVIDQFILEHMDIPFEDLSEVLQKSDAYYRDPASLKEEYYELSEEDRAKKLENAKTNLELTERIIMSSDHQAYFDYMLNEAKTNQENNLAEIERLEQSIIEDPANEEILNEQIENIKKSMKNYEIITMPILEYRIANDIIPGSEDWRDSALNAKESALYDINYSSEIKTQEEFENDHYLKREHETYANYKKSIEDRIETATNNLQIAEKSLETNKPDMQYVEDGTRKKVTNFLWYSLLIAVFATIFAGGLMAREFQSGTVRLLMIRPKSRTKIALSKFFALILICMAVYAVCIILNLITNGIIFGFKDLGYPTYSISTGARGTSFFAYLVPKILACFVVVIFGASVAYFFSIVTRNTALSVSIPLVCFAGSLIAMSIIGYSQKYKWVVYTPLPYVNMPQILTGQYYSRAGVEPILSYGICLLLGLSIIAVAVSTFILKKRDITN